MTDMFQSMGAMKATQETHNVTKFAFALVCYHEEGVILPAEGYMRVVPSLLPRIQG